MESGEVREELRTTQPEQPTEVWIDEYLDQLASELGVPKDKLGSIGVSIERVELPSHINPEVMSDNRQVNIWFNDRRVAVIFETRTESNSVLSQAAYFGVRKIESHR